MAINTKPVIARLARQVVAIQNIRILLLLLRFYGFASINELRTQRTLWLLQSLVMMVKKWWGGGGIPFDIYEILSCVESPYFLLREFASIVEIYKRRIFNSDSAGLGYFALYGTLYLAFS